MVRIVQEWYEQSKVRIVREPVLKQDRLWRKSRSKVKGSQCQGTDPNRNFDFHWRRENLISFDERLWINQSINQWLLTWLKWHSHYEVHSSVVQRCQMTMSGNDCWKRYVFSRCRNVTRDGEDWRWTGNEFQTMDAATANERRPMVVRRYGETSSWSVDDDRRRRRLGRSDTVKYVCVMCAQNARPDFPYAHYISLSKFANKMISFSSRLIVWTRQLDVRRRPTASLQYIFASSRNAY